MTLVLKSCRHFTRIKPQISRIISKSGIDERGWLKLSYRQSFSLSGSLNRWYLTSRRMFLHPESRTRNKQFFGHSNWIWFILNLNYYMRSYLTLRVLVSIPRSSLDHMPMALWVVQVPNLWIQLWNKWVNCLSINPLRYKPWLHLNPPK